MSHGPHDLQVARAALPEVMFLPDIEVALQVKGDDARDLLVAGELGQYFRVGGRLAVLRESFLSALARRSDSDRQLQLLLSDDCEEAGDAPEA